MEPRDGVSSGYLCVCSFGEKKKNPHTQNKLETLADGRRAYPILAEMRADSKFVQVE